MSQAIDSQFISQHESLIAFPLPQIEWWSNSSIETGSSAEECEHDLKGSFYRAGVLFKS